MPGRAHDILVTMRMAPHVHRRQLNAQVYPCGHASSSPLQGEGRGFETLSAHRESDGFQDGGLTT